MMSANSANTPKLIVIVGFMGAGKTTVARELARLLTCLALDLDELITEREGRTPAEIIEHSGEDEFRRIETETLRQVLNERAGDSEQCVIALGGGAWIIPENRDLIAEKAGLSVWLDAPFDLCWQRIKASKEVRPLAATRAAAEKLFAHRRPAYSLSKVHYPVSMNKTAKEITEDIARAVDL